MKRFTDSHEWVEVTDHWATIGVTDYAQRELGDIVYVELPKSGEELSKGSEAAVLESTKAAADVYSPLSGKVTAVNDLLTTEPEKVNSAAEGEGWLFKLELKDPTEVEGLLTQEQYKTMVG